MPKERKNKRNWSDYATKHSFALDLEEGVFTWDEPRKIASDLPRGNLEVVILLIF